MNRQPRSAQEAHHSSEERLERLEKRVFVHELVNWKIQTVLQRMDRLERKLSKVKRDYTDDSPSGE